MIFKIYKLLVILFIIRLYAGFNGFNVSLSIQVNPPFIVYLPFQRNFLFPPNDDKFQRYNLSFNMAGGGFTMKFI